MTEQEIEVEVERRVQARLAAAIATVTDGFEFVYAGQGLSLGLGRVRDLEGRSPRRIKAPDVLPLRDLGVLLDAVKQVATKNAGEINKKMCENREAFLSSARSALEKNTKGRIPLSKVREILDMIAAYFDSHSDIKLNCASIPFDPDKWDYTIRQQIKTKEEFDYFNEKFRNFIAVSGEKPNFTDMDRHGHYGVDATPPRATNLPEEYRSVVMGHWEGEDEIQVTYADELRRMFQSEEVRVTTRAAPRRLRHR
jgi:hypothetical protein